MAPCTLPTTLYRLLKNVYHSLSTVLFSSFRSLHSGTQSSGLREEVARARDGSLPANTEHSCQLGAIKVRAEYIKRLRMVEKFPRGIPTVICSIGSISFIARDVEDGAFNRNENGFRGVGS